MIKTPLGSISIQYNELLIPYSAICLKKTGNFCVDGRYGVVLVNLKKGAHVQVQLAFNRCRAAKKNIETGEQLYLVSFETATTKVSIGTTGDIPNINYQCSNNGLCLNVNSFVERLPIVVAWKHIVGEDDGINTWLAADPALMGINKEAEGKGTVLLS